MKGADIRPGGMSAANRTPSNDDEHHWKISIGYNEIPLANLHSGLMNRLEDGSRLHQRTASRANGRVPHEPVDFDWRNAVREGRAFQTLLQFTHLTNFRPWKTSEEETIRFPTKCKSPGRATTPSSSLNSRRADGIQSTPAGMWPALETS